MLSRFNVDVDGQTPTQNEPPSVLITSPLDGDTFDSGETIAFSGSALDAEDGDVTASLVWTSDKDGLIGTTGSVSAKLSDGNHTITASVTDSGAKTASLSVGITVGTPPEEPTAVFIDYVSYALEGGRNNDKHLLITIALVDDLAGPVSGASVSIDVFRDNAPAASGSGTTGTNGTVTFSLKNAKSGTYTSDVTDVTAAGLTWVDGTPENGFDK